MAAKIEHTRTAEREVRGERGPYIVRLTSAGVLIRVKGSRTTYGPIGYDAIHFLGARQEAHSRGRRRTHV